MLDNSCWWCDSAKLISCQLKDCPEDTLFCIDNKIQKPYVKLGETKDSILCMNLDTDKTCKFAPELTVSIIGVS